MMHISNKNITNVSVNGEPAEVLNLNQRNIDIAVFKYWKGLVDFTKEHYGSQQAITLLKILGDYHDTTK